jgi:DNA-binding transcriptional regulator YiaG
MKKLPVRDYLYQLGGFSTVTLHGNGVTQLTCPSCGDQATSFKAIGELHRKLARAIVTKKTRLSAQEVRFLRDHLGVTNQEFARTLGVTQYQSSRWMKGSPMSTSAERLLRCLVAGQEADLGTLRRTI